MATKLTPLALQNADLLRKLATARYSTIAALAADIGRDQSNVSKSLKALGAAGLVAGKPIGALTDDGRAMVAALDRADGVGADLAPGAHASDHPPAILHQHIRPDPGNPRKEFDLDGLHELKASILREDDLLENLVVRPDPDALDADPPRYMLIAGERRWRAIGLAIEEGHWAKDRPVPSLIKHVDAAAARRIALVENLQRRDLKPMEEARALKELVERDGLSTAEIAADIGFTQRWAQQRLQLLQLSPKLQTRLEAGQLTVEQARTVIAIWPKLPEIKQVELQEGRISVENAKIWLDQQPEPLTPQAELAMAEILAAAQKGVGGSYYPAAEVRAVTERRDDGGNGVKITVRIDDGGVVALLCKRGVLSRDRPERIFEEDVETGRHFVSLGYYGEDTAKRLLPGVADPKRRPALIADLRVKVLGEEAAAALPEGAFATAWLNGPFETDPAVVPEIEAKRAARAQRVRDQEARRAEQERKRAEEKAEQQQRLAKLGEHEQHLRDAANISMAAFSAMLPGLADEAGLTLPLFMSEHGGIIDSAGVPIIDSQYYGYGEDHRPAIRLLVGLVNAAAGVDTPTTEPVPLDPDAPDRGTFIDWIAQRLMEGDDVITRDQAHAKAEAGLDAWLADEAAVYAEDGYDWSEDGAASLAAAIRDNADAAPAEAAE